MRNILFVIALSFTVFGCTKRDTSFVIIDMAEVFESYEMQIELRAEVDQYVSSKQGRIDSLSARANQLAETIQTSSNPQDRDYRTLESMYEKSAREQGVLNESLEEMVQKYDRMIHKRIKANLEKFAKREGVEMILSKGGAYPAVLFDNGTRDVTDDFISFINMEYQGD